MQNHTALFMPARVSHPALHGTTMKVVCIPRNSGDTRGLPASTILMDEGSGAVRAIVNARSLTALRNAAGSLLSTRLVGLHNPISIVTFGAGKQIEAHLDLHLRSFSSITSCAIVNRTLNARVEGLQNRLASRFPHVAFQSISSAGLNFNSIHPSASDATAEVLRSTVHAASLIICATSATAPLFPSSWVRTGTHVVLIGSYTPAMREVDRDLIRRAVSPNAHASWQGGGRTRQVLLVDSRTACAVEAGELIDASVDASEIVEIGECITLEPSGEVLLKTIPEGTALYPGDEIVGQHAVHGPTRDTTDTGQSGDQTDGHGPITMFKSVGVGVQDVAIACAVVAKAEDTGVGTVVADYDA